MPLSRSACALAPLALLVLSVAGRAATNLTITPIPSPAAGESAQPQLSVSDRGVLLSWIERSGPAATLKFAERTASGWSAPRTVASGTDWFVNWADVPSVVRLGDGTLAAHWLQKSGTGTYAYDVRLSWSKDDGATWSPSITPHHDGTQSEHGFASLVQLPGRDAGLGLVWLDGRAMTGGHDGHGGGAMSLRFAAFDRVGKQTSETAVDARVCECCPTAAAVTSDGVIAAYRDRSAEDVRDIYVSRLEQGTWTAPAAVHRDDWRIPACPVNGPALSARGRDVAIAWYTMKNEKGHAQVAFSKDAARSFGAPIALADADTIGRVDVALLSDGSAMASWMEVVGQGAEFRIRRVEPSGKTSQAVTVVPSAVDKRPITETDLFKFVWVADPQITPDGSRIAFVRVTIDEKKDQYDTSLWLAAADGGQAPRQITAGPRDGAPRWSPDGRTLAFVRSPERDGRPQPPQVHLLSMTGGEARAITSLPRGAANPVWSPDGKTIAFSSQTFPDELKPKQSKEKSDDTRVSDVRVITSATYRANGVAGWGFTDPDRPSHVWTVAVPQGSAEPSPPARVTSGEFPAANHRWSSDGSRIYFTSVQRKEAYYFARDSDLFAVPRDGGAAVRIASIDGTIGGFAVSADGRQIAFVGAEHGTPERSYSQPDLFVVDAAGGTPRNLTATYDFDVDGGLAGDQRAPRGQHPAGPVWSRDGRSIVVKTGHHGSANLVRVDVASGRVEPLTRGSHEVMSYTADASDGKLGLVLSSATVVGDLHALDLSASGAPKKLTTFNDELFGQLTLSEPEEIWYPSFDGGKIQGWILKPPAFDPSKKYPLILQIHGGPHAAYGNTFTHEFAWMAAKGYVVLYTNPRGSSNYGQDFGNIIQFRYPGDDYKDLMAGVDALLARGYIDETRLGVTGGSGGGLLTNWVVTQTTRFKAAVSQRDISDWTSFWYTADFTLFTPTWFRKAPFEDPAEFAQRSPITYAAKIQTPLMFILGDEDWRTPPSAGGEPLFRALKYLKRPTAMVRFPGESHELSRSGRPWHRIERLQHIVGWFDKWLLGRDSGTYDVSTPR